MKPCRRTILKVFALLIAGATLNVAVAWAHEVVEHERFRRVLRASADGWSSVHPSPPDSAWRDIIEIDPWVRRGIPAASIGYYLWDNATPFADRWTLHFGDPRLGRSYTLPLRPLWPGFAINTLFYAGVLWVLFCGPFALRRMIRRRRGRCPACAYPIGQSPVCTECGRDVRRR